MARWLSRIDLAAGQRHRLEDPLVPKCGLMRAFLAHARPAEALAQQAPDPNLRIMSAGEITLHTFGYLK